MMKLINEIGNKYGSLTPMSLTKDKNGRTAWLCKCDCGNKKIVRGSDLRKNKILYCSKACPYKRTTLIDETGNIYGRLTVLYKAGKNSSNKTLWHCKCSCGKEVDVIGENLRNNSTISCGCYNKEMSSLKNSKDLTNQRFGLLTAKEKTSSSKVGNIWKCICDCGKEVNILSSSLLSGNTQSCGCQKISHGESVISKLLWDNSILFKAEYSFNDLISKKNKKLRFDFAIFDNYNNLKYLIEYDGQQHYFANEYFGGIQSFNDTKERDNMKNEYCFKNNIPLIRIPYYHKNITIQDLILEESNFILQKET